MSSKWFTRIVQVTVVALTLAAVFQELEKPKEERHWHGKVGFIPYDFRIPTLERLKETYWDVPQRQIETSVVLG